MHNLIFAAGAAGAALAFAFVALRNRDAARDPDVRAERRIEVTTAAGALVVLLLGWAFTAVEIGPSSFTVFGSVAAFLAVGLVFSARARALD